MDECSPTVLIVDDSPTDIEILLENLKAEFSVIVATSGTKALNLAETTPNLAVILLDISMPEMDGYEICRQLKENPDTDHISVIFVSSNNSVEEKLNGYDVGGSDYITKPVEPSELRKKVQVAVKYAEELASYNAQQQAAMDAAMTAISDSGEQAIVVDFLRESFNQNSIEGLANLVMQSTAEFDLSNSVQIRTPLALHNVCSTGPIPELEKELLIRLKDSGRLLQKGKRLIINYPFVSQFIRDLPEDADRVGRLRDYLAIIVEGADNKCRSLIIAEKMRSLIAQCNETILRINKEQKEQQERNIQIVDDLMENVQGSFLSYGLTEDQEKILIKLLEEAIDASIENFSKGQHFEQHFNQVTSELTNLSELL